jgi:hypothetical protein
MAYIGRPLQVANLAVQSGTGDGSDTTPIATLDYATTTNGIAVYLDGVRQLAGTDFNVTAQTTLTFTTAPANGVGVDVYFLGLELSLPTPADGTVATAKIADDAVTLAKMAPGTDGNIISYDASGNPVAIATGTDGQVLTSAGAGAPPLFEALPASEGVAANGFYVRVSGAQANATGDGTIVDMSGIAHGDVIDTGSDVTNGTHTAPATGLYCYVISVNFGGMASGHNQIKIDLVTSNRTRYVLETHGYNTSNSGSQGMWWATVITEMDASDTAYYKYVVNGAAKSCDLQANTSSFAGFRIE